jgi:CheY-like chemotaxis protein
MWRMNHLEACRAVKDDAETRLVPAILATALSALKDRGRDIEWRRAMISLPKP